MARAYDAASNLTVETLSVGATAYNLSYGYDADNRQTAVIYPSGNVVNRAFTDRNQLQSASFNTIPVANLSYDDGRRLSTKSFGNGTVENRTYRNDNLIASIATAGVDTFTYTWDANKRKLTQTEAGIPTNDQNYSYDFEDRLTGFARTNGDAQSWNLSLVGDWNNTIINGTQQNRTHNSVHELLTVNTTPLTYDVKGNITQNSNGQFYSWDVENRLSVATDGFNTLGTYTYDALGRRTSKTVAANTTTFVSDGLQEVAEYVNGTLSQSYVYGSYIDEPLMMVKANGDKFYYHTNDLYSVAALTNSAGSVVERYRYDPYGKVTILAADGITVRTNSIVGNPWTFTGRRLDVETGLMYFRNRMWDVNLGLFISRDPATQNEQDGIGVPEAGMGYYDGTSLYRGYFVSTGLDPFGLKAITIAQAVDLICASLAKYLDKADSAECKKICPEYLLSIFVRESKLDPGAYDGLFVKKPKPAPDAATAAGALGLGGVRGSSADEIRRIAEGRLTGYAPPVDTASQTGADSFVNGGTKTNTGTKKAPAYKYENSDAKAARYDPQANSDLATLNLIDKVSKTNDLKNGISKYGEGTEEYGTSIMGGGQAIAKAAKCAKPNCCTCDELKAWAKNIPEKEEAKFNSDIYEYVRNKK